MEIKLKQVTKPKKQECKECTMYLCRTKTGRIGWRCEVCSAEYEEVKP